jgi:hypothetical protein
MVKEPVKGKIIMIIRKLIRLVVIDRALFLFGKFGDLGIEELGSLEALRLKEKGKG